MQSDSTQQEAQQTRPGDAPPTPLRDDLRSQWSLDPAVTFLNHGSFGATPHKVLDAQTYWRGLLEREPVHFYDRIAPPVLERTIETIGVFLNAPPSCIGLVTNATEGVHAVLRSLQFDAGDEIITTAHAYDAVAHTLRHIASRNGVRVIDTPIELPFDEDALIDHITSKITRRTRLLVIDHVTSISALILPIEKLIALCDERDIEILIDGAHAPGMLPLDLEALRPTYYTGNFHKWVCAPKGAAFLYVDPARREDIHPAIISNHYGQGFASEFAWHGTRDMTPWLCIPDAIDFMADIGWKRVREHNHQLASWAHRLLCATWNASPIYPRGDTHFGAMATIPLPPRAAEIDDRKVANKILYEQYQIEAPSVDVNNRRMMRISCQVYNQPAEYERLAHVIREMFMS